MQQELHTPKDYVLDGLTKEAAELRERWHALREAEPKLRIRDAAAQLGVSEAQLLATGCGENVTRLEGDWNEMLGKLGILGRVMALSRNEHAVHERYGVYGKAEAFHGMGQVAGPDIDLRMFYSHWHFAYAVSEEARGTTRHSLQFFDIDGTAVHKVYASENVAAYETIVAEYKASDQHPHQAVKALPPQEAELPDAEIDVPALKEAWAAMQDTHQFFSLLKRFKVQRTQAFRLVGTEFAVALDVKTPRTLLETAAKEELPIMVFVSNPGIYQIHTGPVKNIQPFGEWINVLDPDFNLHLRETGVDSAWLVRKPTKDGTVTAVEIYDAEGREIALFFGKRKPGQPENESWRQLAENLPRS